MTPNNLGYITTLDEQKPTTRAFIVNDGDCGLVIRKAGNVELFQHRIDTAALCNLHGSLSPSEQQALLNGQLLMALSILANSPELQETILSFAVNQEAVAVRAANSNE
jgi:hypothetical protein